MVNDQAEVIQGQVVSGDYFAGVGPGVASASLSGLPFRAVWVSSDAFLTPW